MRTIWGVNPEPRSLFLAAAALEELAKLETAIADGLIKNKLAAQKSAGHSKFKPDGK